jgi:hypothetical protein
MLSKIVNKQTVIKSNYLSSISVKIPLWQITRRCGKGGGVKSSQWITKRSRRMKSSSCDPTAYRLQRTGRHHFILQQARKRIGVSSGPQGRKLRHAHVLLAKSLNHTIHAYYIRDWETLKKTRIKVSPLTSLRLLLSFFNSSFIYFTCFFTSFIFLHLLHLFLYFLYLSVQLNSIPYLLTPPFFHFFPTQFYSSWEWNVEKKRDPIFFNPNFLQSLLVNSENCVNNAYNGM